MTRIRLRFLVGALAVVLAIPGVRASGETPPKILTVANDSTRPLAWDGTAVLAPAGVQQSQLRDASFTAGAAHQRFVAKVGPAREARVTIWIHWETPEDLALAVTDGKQTTYASSDEQAGTDEIVSFDVANGATYTVEVYAKAGAPTGVRPQYEATAWVRHADGINTTKRANATLKFVKPNVCGDPNYRVDANGSRVYEPPPPCYMKLKMPINVVFVGFDKAEVDAHKPDVAGQFPDPDPRAQLVKPIVENESRTGGGVPLARNGGSQVRQAAMLQGSAMSYLPWAYDFGEPNIVVTDEAWTRRLFGAAKAATTSGEYAHPWDRAYLESYNGRAAALRRDHPVVPGSPVDFIDAMKVEDWIAKNPPKGLKFNPADSALGFTYFVIDTYRPSYAGEYFNVDRYHNFRVMNSLTTDPDTGEQRGFDWGRVWGGRYRFLMLDVGAAPNSFEGSTPVNGATYRVAGGGDSALLDPPVWEYANCAAIDCRDLLPIMYQRIGENALSALYTRFARGYATRPRATDLYLLSSNTWTDANAVTDAPPRYDAKRVAASVYDLMRYTRVVPFTRAKTLHAGDAEQEALDAARMQSAARLPSGTGADPHPVMRMMLRDRAAYAPKIPGSISIPIVNALLPGATSWNGADADGSLLADLGGDPWGLVQSISDAGAAPVERGFTVPAIRNVGRVLGLYPATEGIAYTRDLPPDVNAPRPHPAKADEQYRAYYKTFDWTHATTATPMAAGWFYSRFEILDKDAIGIAHAFDWLDRSLDDVADAFAILDVRGHRTLPKAVEDQIMRAGTFMGQTVAYVQFGLMTQAVRAARRAKTETEKVVTTAIRAGVRR
ncbi:MAG TPA: PPC domain-containing protein [Actinomycetota bacterium]